MLRIKKTKWIARALALALTGGVAVVTTACTDEDNAIVQDREDTRESDTALEESVHDRPEETGDSPEIAEKPPESEEQDYNELAARIEEGAVAYLEAIKAGDIETILSMTAPEDVIYDKLSGIQDFETGKEFIRTLFGDLTYEWQEDRSTERYVGEAMNGELGVEPFFLDLYIGMPHTIFFNSCLTVPGVMFQDGEKIPDGYKVTSDEDALRIVRSIAEMLPLEDTTIKVELQDDGVFYFEMVGPFMCMDGTAFHSGENFLPDYLSDKIYDGVVVGKSDGLFRGYQEEWTEILSLLQQKDFEGLIALANGNPDKYIKKVLSTWTPYRTPEELTEAQRAFFDSYVEQIEVYVSEMTFGNLRDVDVIFVTPAIGLYDDEDMEWYTEKGIKDCTLVSELGGDRERNLISVMSDLLSPIEDAIEYAEKNY
ncbi:MAG: hypothetical protein NC543_15500 [bacterium]|nr:hypothetical protein [bacterium]MCM1376192.1 hypothetical protein [Muribaculum sp.]